MSYAFPKTNPILKHSNAPSNALGIYELISKSMHYCVLKPKSEHFAGMQFGHAINGAPVMPVPGMSQSLNPVEEMDHRYVMSCF